MLKEFITKKRVSCVISFWMICLVVIEIDMPNAEAQEWSLSDKFIDSILSLPEQRIHLGQVILEISRRASLDLLNESIKKGDSKQQLDLMAKDIKRSFKRGFGPREKLAVLNEYFFKRQNFAVDRSKLFESTLEALLFENVLKQKKGQCLSLSMLYLILGEKSGLPLYGVMVPGHFFVRFQGDQVYNIETTNQGKAFSDRDYQMSYLKGYRDEISLKNLNKKEVIAVYLSNVANHYKLRGFHDKAILIFQAVVKVMPQWASLYTNLGNAFEREGNIVEAANHYQKALSLNPYLCETHYNLGLLHYLYTKNFIFAKRHGDIARKLGCRMHPEFKNFLEGR